MSDNAKPLSSDIASTATLKLASLHSLDTFYTPLEERFERITRLARQALGVPVAAITMVKDDRQWFKSVNGWQVTELPMSQSLCSEVIKTGEQIIVNDTLDDLYLMSNPLVCNGPKFRFYAGYAIKDSVGDTIGSFCVMDIKPRKADPEFAITFSDLAGMAEHEMFSSELNSAQSALITKLGESRRQAMLDSLTRLWNRRGGMDLLEVAMQDAAKFDHTLGLCLADIDHFKKVNDTYGHPVGDQILRKVASAMVAAVRPHDVVCRYGGEEFMIIVRDVDARTCFAVANRICANVRDMPIRTREAAVPTTISIGIAMREKGDVTNTQQLIARADRALYKSKDNGRNRVTFAKD